MSAFLSPIFLWVLLGAVLFGLASASVGSFAYLRRRSLVGDALAHAALPGITIAFAVTGSRLSEVLLLGAGTSCLLAYIFIEMVSAHSKLKQDTVLAVTLSFFFAIGIFHLTELQSSPTASQAGLDKLIFGQAAAITQRDVYSLVLLSFSIVVVLFALYHRLLLISFDRACAVAMGIRVKVYDIILLLLTVAAIVLGLQLVGVVLMAALLITPAAAARFWTSESQKFVLLSAFFGLLAGAWGTCISALYPKMPTGPWIVLVASALFFLSLLLGAEKGVLWAMRDRLRFGRMERRENVVRSIFLLEEEQAFSGVTFEQILRYRSLNRRQLARQIESLRESGFLQLTGDNQWTLTSLGREMGERLTRRHRLFEVYLTEKAQFPATHVHEYAERAEHVFTSELEKEVQQEVSATTRDPHGKEIPK